LDLPVRIGVVGCGSVSQRGILPHLSQGDIGDKLRLVAVCDVVAERAEACKKRFGADQHYGDYEEMLSEAGLDAVTIATPTQLHYDQALKAARSGINVHLNKPMTLTAKEADDLLSARDAARIKLVVSPGTAFNGDVQRVRHILTQGVIGKIYWARSGATSEGHETEEFRRPGDAVTAVDSSWYYRKGGGPLYDMAVYALHLVTGVMGPAKRVSAMSGIGQKRRSVLGKEVNVVMDDNTVMLLDFGEATFAMLHSAFCSGDGEPFSRLHVAGSDGALDLGHKMIELWGRRISDGHRVEGLPRRLPYASGIHLELEESHIFSDIMHLVDCIMNDKTPVISGEHARHVVEIIEKAYVAAETGTTQGLGTSFRSDLLKEW
jgi:predicted dehydrogenase